MDEHILIIHGNIKTLLINKQKIITFLIVIVRLVIDDRKRRQFIFKMFKIKSLL